MGDLLFFCAAHLILTAARDIQNIFKAVLKEDCQHPPVQVVNRRACALRQSEIFIKETRAQACKDFTAGTCFQPLPA